MAQSPSPLSKANTSFALALFKKLSEPDNTANVFYSPFSISSALAMVLLGARGNTATQMSEVLCFREAEKPQEAGQMRMQLHSQMQQIVKTCHLPPHLMKRCLQTKNCGDDVHASFAGVMSEIIKPGAPYALSVANKLYGEQTYTFVEDFLTSTRKHYNAELESVDFQNKADDSRININSWVEGQTQGKVKDLLVPGIVNELTRLVLVNAIYFKGNWSKQFKESSTIDAQFKLNKNNTKPVKMMQQKTKLPLAFIPELNCQILELPYEGKDLSMLIFLPRTIEDATTGLEKLERELTYENFMEWTRPDMMDMEEVQVKLPRFKMEEKYDLKTILTSMGMVDAFDLAQSDFSGMSPSNDLVLSKVVHKAVVEVNEEGTEAAAATAAIMMLRCAMFSPTFNADHPFLFFIRHNPTASILFAGRFSSPE